MGQLQPCCIKGCHREGVPAKGFDFFACEQCLDELEHMIAALYQQEAALAELKRGMKAEATQ